MPDNKFDISLYNDEFFEWHLKYAREYSIRTMDWFIEKYKPESVIDFGCGIGSYLESAHNHGLDILGLEISEAAKKYTPSPLTRFIAYMDCAKPIDWNIGIADCVISFETAEHIEPSGTDQFIDNLVNATGKYLLFTAAPPGQEGCGHINCQPYIYWIQKIGQFIEPDVEMTKDISDNWRALGAPNYICDNLIVFKR
jgi:cyclopropane fatty-acyl-phospholipid synthase-like methyltransferase